jgi:hypothetical protein
MGTQDAQFNRLIKQVSQMNTFTKDDADKIVKGL